MTKCKYEYMITCFIDTVIYTQNIYLVDSLSYYKRYVFIIPMININMCMDLYKLFSQQIILQHFLMLCTCIYDIEGDIRE